MYDLDISGENLDVSLVFENKKVDGARKIMQKVMLWLVQDPTDTTVYGTGFYSAVRGSNISAVSIIQGRLDIALSNIKTNLAVVRDPSDPVVTELVGTVYKDDNVPDKIKVDISMDLSNGDTANGSLTV